VLERLRNDADHSEDGVGRLGGARRPIAGIAGLVGVIWVRIVRRIPSRTKNGFVARRGGWGVTVMKLVRQLPWASRAIARIQRWGDFGGNVRARRDGRGNIMRDGFTANKGGGHQ
jgi:hypothetical protein